MPEKDWLDYIVAIGTVATPILVLVLTGVGWMYRQSMERKLQLEEKLRSDRIEIYNEILEPFIMLLMSDAAWSRDRKNRSKNKSDLALEKMLSLDYRKVAFKLSLLGSDSVVSSYNDLMQHFYGLAENEQSLSDTQAKETLTLLGSFLLEIRRSMGNENTQIDNWDMIEWFITDAREIRAGTASLSKGE